MAGVVNEAHEMVHALKTHRRIAREVYGYHSSRAQAVLHVPFVFVMMLYPTLIGFCLAVRLARFNLMVPTPNLANTPDAVAALGGKGDLWKTCGPGDIALLAFTLFMVSVVHLYLTSFLVMRGPAAGPRMATRFFWIPPIVFWGCTSIYFVYFIHVARYGPSTFEWIAVAIASGFILLLTGLMLLYPFKTGDVVQGLGGPGGDYFV